MPSDYITGGYAIDDDAPLADVLGAAVSQAGLAGEDVPVQRARRLLAEQFFLNAYTLRFKRQMTGDWDWLQRPPFQIPMCLADLIGDCLDRLTGAKARRTAPLSICDDDLPNNAALKVLLGQQRPDRSKTPPALIDSVVSSQELQTKLMVPTLSSIRLEPIHLLDSGGYCQDAADDNDESMHLPFPKARSAGRPRGSNNASRKRPAARAKPGRPKSTSVASSDKTKASDKTTISSEPRSQRKSSRSIQFVKLIEEFAESLDETKPFDIDMVYAVDQSESDSSSSYDDSESESEHHDSTQSEPKRSSSAPPPEQSANAGPHEVGDADQDIQVDSKCIEPDVRNKNEYVNGTSPKRSRIGCAFRRSGPEWAVMATDNLPISSSRD